MTYRTLPSIFRLNKEYTKSSQAHTGDTDGQVGRDQVVICLKPRAMDFALGVGEIHPCTESQCKPGHFGKGEVQVESSFREVSAEN